MKSAWERLVTPKEIAAELGGRFEVVKDFHHPMGQIFSRGGHVVVVRHLSKCFRVIGRTGVLKHVDGWGNDPKAAVASFRVAAQKLQGEIQGVLEDLGEDAY